MGKQNKVINAKRLLAAGFALITLGGSRLYAQDVPEGIPPVKAEDMDPVAQARQERDQFVKEIRRVENLNRKYTKQIDEIKDLLAEKDADFQKRMKELEEKLTRQNDDSSKKAVAQEQVAQTARELETKTNEMLSKGGDLDPEDQQFKDELAKAREKGDYEEYEQIEKQLVSDRKSLQAELEEKKEKVRTAK